MQGRFGRIGDGDDGLDGFLGIAGLLACLGSEIVSGFAGGVFVFRQFVCGEFAGAAEEVGAEGAGLDDGDAVAAAEKFMREEEAEAGRTKCRERFNLRVALHS